ncbi:Bug family tripartite tricarboxylate transporter substrate binding protein [Caldovatus aquaticus]|uniref:Tripartite tricarboxylate transporter substrate binding protein n=1 Tax=Caldovatus aquaticus TaxID=2865671 RepID=A0ABS7EZN7_9PROT|nr:tripartite tricarboxylate transporter substrate binding protein [Caldovatus aquaticus]MBW8268769.1 tripartite tricarboxylate transporter substrate binding protein [Caldovatus aquaticus]
MLRRRQLALALGLGASAAAAGAGRPALAQGAAANWPSQPVRLIVPFAAGGPTDIPARLIADELSKILPQRVIVENRTGSGVVVGTEVVAKAPKDGHTVLYTTIAHSVLPALFQRLPFDPVADFTPVVLVGQIPMILLVNKDVPARTLPELIRLLRENPGKYDYASSGNGGAVHLATELFLARAGGLKVNHIPYRGSSAAMPDVINGRVAMIVDVAAGALPYAQRGELRALAISTRERAPFAPDLPTFVEGGVPDYEAYTWHMMLVPAGTPQPVVQALNAAVNRVLQQEHVRRRLTEMTMQLASDTTPEGAVRWMRAEMDKWGAIIRQAGITVN